MEEVAQGRVWSGKDAASRGLVDAIGGFSRAVAIAKQKANIPQEKQVKLHFFFLILMHPSLIDRLKLVQKLFLIVVVRFCLFMACLIH